MNKSNKDKEMAKKLHARMNATAKDHLFGNLRILEKLAREMPEGSLQHKMGRHIERALSWEPLITNKENIPTHNE